MLSAKTSRELKDSAICGPSIDTSRPSRDPISLFQISTSMSESSLRVITLPSLGYPSFKLDIEQDDICKALFIGQVTEWVEWFCSFLLIPSILE